MVMPNGFYFMFPLPETGFWTQQIVHYETAIHTLCG